MNIRLPARAGSFYEASPSSCQLHAQRLIDQARLPSDLPGALYGGLVPHAGWDYSGTLAAMTLKALHEKQGLQTVVLLGAVHVAGAAQVGEVFDSGVWRTPLGEMMVDSDLAGAILAADTKALRANPAAHEVEHSLEVQLPLIQTLASQAKIVPIAVPPKALAMDVGRAVAKAIADSGIQAVVVGSTDLTHHGGQFGAPGGHGEAGVRWSEANDRQMLDHIEKLSAQEIIPEANRCQNACGAGAITATIEACRQLGATRGLLLEYTNSYRIIREIYPTDPDDTSVGYASVVFA